MKRLKSRRKVLARVFALLCVTATVVPCLAQDTAKPKPNISVSGCVMREGYGTIVVSNAIVDAVGEGASTAAPGAAKSSVKDAPDKWVLDHPGPAGQHVGEKIQIIGLSSWTALQAPSKDEPSTPPHIEVQSFKVLSSSCS